MGMTVEDFRKFIWSNSEDLSENTVIYADIYDKQRRKAIKYKVEKNVNVNREQMKIDDYYRTSKGGYIAWVKTDRRLISEIHRRAAKSSLKSFRTTLYMPKVARDRKGSVDRLLMAYKKTNSDFRYLIRNDSKDIKVLIKRLSEGETLPYRPISLNVLGRLSPLKTQIKESPEEVEEAEETLPDGFSLPGSGRKKDNFVPKEIIFRNITALLDGFSLEQEQKKTQRQLY